MKKISILLVVLIMLFATTMSAYAGNLYTHKELYSIELPDEYEYFEDISTDELPIFATPDGKSNININYVKNTEKVFFVNLTEEDFEDLKQMFETSTLTELAKQGETSAEVNVLSVESKKLSNGYTALVSVVETKISTGILNQKIYQFSGVNYIYTITITSQNKKRLVELDNVIETFKMTEDEFVPMENAVTPDTSDGATDSTSPEEDSGSIISIAIFAVFIVAIIVVIIITNKNQKKKQQEQLNSPIQSIFDTQQSKQIQDELSNYNNNNFQ